MLLVRPEMAHRTGCIIKDSVAAKPKTVLPLNILWELIALELLKGRIYSYLALDFFFNVCSIGKLRDIIQKRILEK